LTRMKTARVEHGHSQMKNRHIRVDPCASVAVFFRRRE